MNKKEAVEQFKYAIELIKQDGKDYLDERDIPMLEMGIKALENQKIGHWESHPYDHIGDDCSVCGARWTNTKAYKHCPSCGAKMEGE